MVIIGNSFFLSDKQSVDEFPKYACGRDGHCSMIISVLRDPRLMPAWTTKANAWNKAMEQMHAYQQLFSSENDEPIDNIIPDIENESEHPLEQNDEPIDNIIPDIENESEHPLERSSRTKRFLPIFSTPKRHRPSKEDNMYWLIRMPGK
uniref:Uncharacterized protein n=1 Tax=Panagrolaimus sp. PS1159 TaxID=55785 RepID=A0AC35FK14_9BILA